MHIQMRPLVCVWALAVLIAGASDLQPSGHKESLDICAITSFDNGQRFVLGHWERHQSNNTLEFASILLQSWKCMHRKHCHKQHQEQHSPQQSSSHFSFASYATREYD